MIPKREVTLTFSRDKSLSIIDISPSIHEAIAVWPGDQVFKRKYSMSLRNGDNIDLSQITTSLHLGSHADSPSHYSSPGIGIDEVPLHYYNGLCQVIQVATSKGKRIYPEDINVEIEASRVLFKTDTYPNPNVFNTDFCSLSKDLVTYLGDKGVILIGIDTPSVDLYHDKILESHHALLEKNIMNIEGLVLDTVRPGLYTLFASPLKIEGADAAPLRAILVENLL
ncbi:MAG: cyclase family protein [Bdellovibrionales bacterium]|nr:cyclase family protein [Bdellovibrionales bacterium]